MTNSTVEPGDSLRACMYCGEPEVDISHFWITSGYNACPVFVSFYHLRSGLLYYGVEITCICGEAIEWNDEVMFKHAIEGDYCSHRSLFEAGATIALTHPEGMP